MKLYKRFHLRIKGVEIDTLKVDVVTRKINLFNLVRGGKVLETVEESQTYS